MSYVIAYRGCVTSNDGWVRLNGSIDAPQKGSNFFIFIFYFSDQFIVYLVLCPHNGRTFPPLLWPKSPAVEKFVQVS